MAWTILVTLSVFFGVVSALLLVAAMLYGEWFKLPKLADSDAPDFRYRFVAWNMKHDVSLSTLMLASTIIFIVLLIMLFVGAGMS